MKLIPALRDSFRSSLTALCGIPVKIIRPVCTSFSHPAYHSDSIHPSHPGVVRCTWMQRPSLHSFVWTITLQEFCLGSTKHTLHSLGVKIYDELKYSWFLNRSKAGEDVCLTDTVCSKVLATLTALKMFLCVISSFGAWFIWEDSLFLMCTCAENVTKSFLQYMHRPCPVVIQLSRFSDRFERCTW